jgi:hypothetical protein
MRNSDAMHIAVELRPGTADDGENIIAGESDVKYFVCI